MCLGCLILSMFPILDMVYAIHSVKVIMLPQTSCIPSRIKSSTVAGKHNFTLLQHISDSGTV